MTEIIDAHAHVMRSQDHGRELWSTDGTAAGTHLVKDILPGAGGSYPLGLTVLNGAVYFHASGPEGDELWRTNGTAAGIALGLYQRARDRAAKAEGIAAAPEAFLGLLKGRNFGKLLVRVAPDA